MKNPLMSSSESFSRRDLIKGAGPALLALWAVLNGCAPAKDLDNSQLLEFLKSELELTPSTTRKELAGIAYQKAVDPDWFINASIGMYHNLRGESVELSTDSVGELIVNRPEPEAIKYPAPEGPEEDHAFLSDGKENHLIIYGTRDTVGRSGGWGESVIEEFLREYFADAKSAINRIHLDFTPVAGGEAFSMFVPSQQDLQTGTISYPFQDVTIQVNRAHLYAEWLGMSLEDMLRFGFSNEQVGFLEDQFPDTDGNRPPTINESYSTLAGLASALDVSVSRLTLGGNSYSDLFGAIAKEMETLRIQ